MVQATAAALAVSLAFIAMPALAVDAPTCEQVREQAKNYSMKQIRAMAKRAQLTDEQWSQVKRCLGDKK